MKNVSIDKSVITFGSNNVINYNHDDNFDWDKLKGEFFTLLHRLPEISEETRAANDAYEYIIKKDKKNLIDYIKKHASKFTSSVVEKTASAFLIEFIKSIIL